MAQRQWERTTPSPGEKDEEEMEGGRTMGEDNGDRGRLEIAVGYVGEVPVPPGVRHAIIEEEGGESNELRTVMEAM